MDNELDKYILENICPECYRELPNHGPGCSRSNNEESDSDLANNEIDSIEDNDGEHNNREVLSGSEIAENNPESNLETRDNQEKIAELKEQVKEFFGIARGELARHRLSLDMIIDEAVHKSEELIKCLPPDKPHYSIEDLEAFRNVIGNKILSLQTDLMAGEERSLLNLDNLDTDQLSANEIAIIKKSYNELFETITNRLKKTEETIDNYRHIPERIQNLIDKANNK